MIIAKVDPTVAKTAVEDLATGARNKYSFAGMFFVRHIDETEGTVIMGPSEHN